MEKIEVGSKITSFALPGGKSGIITKICDKVSDDGHQIYELLDENGEMHQMCETLFDDENDLSSRELDNDSITSKEDSYITKIKEENEGEIERLIEVLGLKSSIDPYDQLRNCCLLHAYIADNNDYNANVMDEKVNYSSEFITDIDLHNALIKKNGVCSSNSLMFQSILSRLGISVECVALISNNGGAHMANIVLLDGTWYYFDTTREGGIPKEEKNPEISLYYAGLGSGEYHSLYTPECVVRKNGVCALPQNIATDRIPPLVINGFFKQPTFSGKKI